MMNNKDNDGAANKIAIEVNPIEGTITRGDNCTKLEPLIFNLLVYLSQNAGKVINRQQLMEDVWESPYASDSAINRGISALRKALGGNKDDFIKTLPKKGYAFSLPDNVELINAELVNVEPEAPAVKSTDTVIDDVTDQQPQVSAAVEQPTRTIPPTRMTRLSLGLKRALAIGAVGLVCAAGFYDFESEQLPAPMPSSNSGDIITAKVFTPLYIEPITVNTTDKNASLMVTTLQSQIVNKLYSVKKIKPIVAIEQQSTAQTNQGVQFKSQLNVIDGQINLQLTLFDFSKQELIYSTVLKSPVDSITGAELFFTDEVIAIIKLFIFHKRYAYDYLKALDPMTYQDIKLLAVVRSYLDQSADTGLAYSLQTLKALEAKYPDNAAILGLKALAWSKRLNYDDSDFERRVAQLVEFGARALVKDPENHDATLTLFYFTNTNSHSREKSRHYMNHLMRYNSDRMSTWRAQLYSMTRDAAPCNEIRTFVNRIPDGLFKPIRVKVIHQILDSCENQTGVEALVAQQSNLPNSRLDRAIHKNLFLFKRKHNKVLDSVDYHLKINPSMSTLNDGVMLYSMFGDAVGVNSLLKKLDNSSDGFWHAQAQLIDYVNRGGSEYNQQVLDLVNYDFLNRRTELLMVSYMAQLLQQGKTDTRYLQKYIDGHQEFSISIATRQESLALMSAYHAIGDMEQSQAIAHRLYEALERYRQEDIASFRFWYLGQLHLTAKYYCGGRCQTDESATSYLDKIFAANHPWWGDHLGFMVQTLKPWAEDELVKAYLNKVRESVEMVQSKR